MQCGNTITTAAEVELHEMSRDVVNDSKCQ